MISQKYNIIVEFTTFEDFVSLKEQAKIKLNKLKIIISGDKTSIVVKATGLPVLNRTSLGNIMLKNNEKVISIAKI